MEDYEGNVMNKNKAANSVLIFTLILSMLLVLMPQRTYSADTSGLVSQSTSSAVTTGEIGVYEYESIGSALTKITTDDFNAFGFLYGDSVDICFDNGVKFEDVPYYNGYYGRTGTVVACGYPAIGHVAIAYVFGEPMWEKAGLNAQSKVTITMHEKSKYLTIQEAMETVQSNDRADFDSDAEFANFYEIVGGNIKTNTFYRSSSPCDNTFNRAAYADTLAEQTGIRYELNLSESLDGITAHMTTEGYSSDYYSELCREGNVLPMHLGVNFRSEKFAKATANALLGICGKQEPYLIHCMKGEDRTGQVSTLILCLAGANTEEITADFMKTFENYYGITKESDSEKYDAIVDVKLNDILYYLSGAKEGSDLTNVSSIEGAKKYLKFGGLSDEQITQVIDNISR